MTNDKSEIYSKWYKKNKDSLNEKKAQRYKEDKEYREKIKERARERSRFLAAQNKKAIKGKSGPIPPKEYTIRINGTAFKVKMYTIGSIAKILKREIQTVRQWERKGLIPAAMYRSKDQKGFRLYTELQVNGIREAYRQAIAEDGIVAVTNQISKTCFPRLVQQLWDDYPKGIDLS